MVGEQRRCSIVNMPRFSQVFALVLLACTFGLSACSSGVESPPTIAEPVVEGPHADADRKLATRTETENAAGTATIIDVDFGNVSEAGFSAPARGVVVVPKQASGPMPVVVMSHLRAPNCADGTFAYPCAEGIGEHRFDRGMTYLGEALAAQGYVSVIPDFGGVFVGVDVSDPYDQNKMWKAVVSRFVEGLKQDSNRFPQPVNLDSVGLVLHSRSAAMVDSAVDVFGEGKVKSVFTYGAAYDTFDLEHISPTPPDIPYLGLVGEGDSDVGASANLWLGHHLLDQRKQPASVVALPGLGHMLINREAAAAGIGDMIGCDVRECPDAAEHERIVSALAADWLNATVRGAASILPVSAAEPLPNKVADVEARWLASTPEAMAHIGPNEFRPVDGGTAQVCVNADPMNPEPVEQGCAVAERGVVNIVAEVNYITDGRADANVAGARGMAVHVSPSGTYDAAGTAITVTLRLRDGNQFEYAIPETDPALVDRYSEFDNGVYQLGTVRVPLAEAVTDGEIESVRVTSAGRPVELRGVDFW